MDQSSHNSNYRTKVAAYRRTDVMTANRETILLMMYGGAIRFLKKAIQAVEAGDLGEKGRMLGKTQDVVNELRSTLNFEVGGQIAKDLEKLYVYITERLFAGNHANQIDPLREALNILETLNGAWEQAIQSVKQNKTQQEKKGE